MLVEWIVFIKDDNRSVFMLSKLTLFSFSENYILKLNLRVQSEAYLCQSFEIFIDSDCCFKDCDECLTSVCFARLSMREVSRVLPKDTAVHLKNLSVLRIRHSAASLSQDLGGHFHRWLWEIYERISYYSAHFPFISAFPNVAAHLNE